MGGWHADLIPACKTKRQNKKAFLRYVRKKAFLLLHRKLRKKCLANLPSRLSSSSLACINCAIRQIDRESSAITYENTLTPPPAPILVLHQFLRREEPRLHIFRHRSDMPPRARSLRNSQPRTCKPASELTEPRALTSDRARLGFRLRMQIRALVFAAPFFV